MTEDKDKKTNKETEEKKQYSDFTVIKSKTWEKLKEKLDRGY